MKEVCVFPNVFKKAHDVGPLLLRLAVGIIFILHGISKLGALDKTASFFAGIGIPAAGFAAGLVAVVELGGGILLILGLFTRQASLLLAIVMIVAILTVKLKMGFPAMDIDVVLLAGSLSLLFTGPGKYSLMH
jgi:putative oxidoreductase